MARNGAPSRSPGLKDLHHVFVRQRRGHAGLVEQALVRVVVPFAGGQQALDDHAAPKSADALLAGDEDLAHAAHGDAFQDAVAVAHAGQASSREPHSITARTIDRV